MSHGSYITAVWNSLKLRRWIKSNDMVDSSFDFVKKSLDTEQKRRIYLIRKNVKKNKTWTINSGGKSYIAWHSEPASFFFISRLDIISFYQLTLYNILNSYQRNFVKPKSRDELLVWILASALVMEGKKKCSLGWLKVSGLHIRSCVTSDGDKW